VWTQLSPFLAKAFFPSKESVVLQQLNFWLVYAVGFLFRPLGSLCECAHWYSLTAASLIYIEACCIPLLSALPSAAARLNPLVTAAVLLCMLLQFSATCVMSWGAE
jgi:hypothetical protein